MNTVTVPDPRGYEIRIGYGLLDTLGAAVKPYAAGKVLVVTDENVAPLYLARVYQSLCAAGLRVFTVSVPAGEASKSIRYYVNLLELCAAKGLTRADAILALGGGVVGDLAGFTAATYLRGVRLVHVPTSLLAMVDSSVGGKTALDLPAGKNLVGAFYRPSLVLCDLDTLDTLPEDVFCDGCAEIVKTAILFDPDLLARLRGCGKDFDREAVVARCVAHKRDTVCEDEFDAGARQKLNLGHTVAHAVEVLSGFSVSHGRAVSIGLAIMTRAFCPEAAEIEAVLRQFGLPVTTEFTADELARAAWSDKKRSGDTLTLAVPRAIGRCTLETIPFSALRDILQAGL